VPLTRGPEKSRPVNNIIKDVKSLVKNGAKEILLLGQNVNSYRGCLGKNSSSEALAKKNKHIGFPELLRLINNILGDFTIKFLTSHPKDMSDELINAIAECKKISREIHLPIQSGDNTILKKMNRNYTTEHYKKLIKKIRGKIPSAIISTDVIVGFPGETEKQFENTLKLCREIKFAKAYIAQYSPRIGTAAYKLKDSVSKQEKKHRWQIINYLINKKS
jgi:tRNA-2-methylthio-N6-dimethylallyladenosine synthase